MNRRSFFRRALPGALVGAAVAPKIAEAVGVVADLPDQITTHDGIDARWLGWKRPVDVDRSWGAWIFTRSDGQMSYSTTGGVLYRAHQQGHVLNMMQCYDVAPWLSANAPDVLLATERRAAYDRGLADMRAWIAAPPIEQCGYVLTAPILIGGRFPNAR